PDALERASAALGGRPDPLQHISQLNPSVPPQVAQVLMQGMAQMPEHRWVSAKAMRNALNEAMKGGPATAVQRGPETMPVSPSPSGYPSGPPSMPQSGGQGMP